ncbi:MAG: anaerobic ribonucleoside-triphosphate reductase activating protein [Candidatus Borkfalkiaceae bacterium]|nr:anaerobic ribonucleoside-triphosphate reductase activating protein [Clostridia bacterium]MDY6223472.1 anaerobic ribonucleoside-triphosphate reductase activating protein [Christensenellaceae bacterium]
MNYATIKWTDIANGEGVRISLFVSGCTRRCKNCFNAVAWDFDYGSPFTKEVQESILQGLEADYISGLSLLGGEPLEPDNQRALLPFVREAKKRFPQKNVWCYTGNTFDPETGLLKEKEKNTEVTEELLSYIDVLVDGEFIEEKKNIRLKFRGSSNQRVLDVKKSKILKTPVFYLD